MPVSLITTLSKQYHCVFWIIYAISIGPIYSFVPMYFPTLHTDQPWRRDSMTDPVQISSEKIGSWSSVLSESWLDFSGDWSWARFSQQSTDCSTHALYIFISIYIAFVFPGAPAFSCLVSNVTLQWEVLCLYINVCLWRPLCIRISGRVVRT